jgi:inner membrane protein
MDNLTHTLFGLTLGRTPLGRAGRGTTVALILASNAPDIDVVTAARGMDNYLQWHRGPTHGPLGIVGLGLLSAALTTAALRLSPRKEGEPEDAPFGTLTAIAMIGVLCHVLMDLPTTYGTRLFSPFSWRWFSVDLMPIVDVYLLGMLVAGLLFGWRSLESRRRNAAIVLVLMAANYGVRVVAHHQALEQAPRLFGPTLPKGCDAEPSGRLVDSWPNAPAASPPEPGKRCLVQIVAEPTFYSPFHWRVIAQLSNAYEVQDFDLLDARFRRPAEAGEVMWRTTFRVPNVWTPAVHAAAATPLGQTFLGFARLPAARSFVDTAGAATVRWSDLRFIGRRMALAPPQNDPLTVVIRIGPDGRILEQRLGP